MTEWRAIPAFPKYEVSDDGRVRGKRGELARHVDADGYFRLGLYRDGKRINCRVHTLVAGAFLGERPIGAVARHINGDSMNNAQTNLRWGTQSQNVRDSVEHGTHRNIKKSHCPRMHAYDEANTRIEDAGNRKCRTCCADRERRRRATNRRAS